MIELTEQQEQEMIERAKSGDPEANYNMSLWALEQAMSEPDEERWNRLAAKCLVKAAEAGYGPAKEKMDELLIHTAEPEPSETAETPAEPADATKDDIPPAPEAAAPAVGAGDREAGTHEPAPAPEPEAPPETAHAPVIAAGAEEDEGASAVPAEAKPKVDIAAVFAGIGAKAKALFAKKPAASPSDPSADGESGDGNSGDGKKIPFLDFSQWDEAKWKKMQTICIIVCVILAILIAIMLITGRNKRSAEPEVDEPALPVEDVVTTPIPATPTPEPSGYPAQDIRAEIAEANLDVFPEDGDYVTEPTTVTVSTNGSGLNVRRGPGSSYGQVSALDNGDSVEVYAYKNGWGLVKVDGVWGWCSKDFLK